MMAFSLVSLVFGLVSFMFALLFLSFSNILVHGYGLNKKQDAGVRWYKGPKYKAYQGYGASQSY